MKIITGVIPSIPFLMCIVERMGVRIFQDHFGIEIDIVKKNLKLSVFVWNRDETLDCEINHAEWFSTLCSV